MTTAKKQIGELGESEVCELVPCPNCQSKLIKLPEGFPMLDIQCSRCLFRAQVKTISSSPRKSIRGAGWDIYEKVMKAGYLPPSLIVNFRWADKNGFHREIYFYPFIAKGNIQKYQLKPTAKRANYRMFRYINLDKISSLQLYSSVDPLKRDSLAESV